MDGTENISDIKLLTLWIGLKQIEVFTSTEPKYNNHSGLPPKSDTFKKIILLAAKSVIGEKQIERNYYNEIRKLIYNYEYYAGKFLNKLLEDKETPEGVKDNNQSKTIYILENFQEFSDQINREIIDIRNKLTVELESLEKYLGGDADELAIDALNEVETILSEKTRERVIQEMNISWVNIFCPGFVNPDCLGFSIMCTIPTCGGGGIGSLIWGACNLANDTLPGATVTKATLALHAMGVVGGVICMISTVFVLCGLYRWHDHSIPQRKESLELKSTIGKLSKLIGPLSKITAQTYGQEMERDDETAASPTIAATSDPSLFEVATRAAATRSPSKPTAVVAEEMVDRGSLPAAAEAVEVEVAAAKAEAAALAEEESKKYLTERLGGKNKKRKSTQKQNKPKNKKNKSKRRNKKRKTQKKNKK